jgi:predicted MFS family arabinose efflux permease
MNTSLEGDTYKQTIAAENRLLFLLAFVFFAHVMDFVIMMPLGDVLINELEISARQFSQLIYIYSILAFAMGIISAMFTDRFDRRTALMITLTGFTIGAFLCGFADNYYLLLLARGFTGAFGGVTGGIIYAIVSDVVPFERRGRALGIITGSFSLASIIGIPFSLWLAGKLNWQAPFIFFGIVSAISWIAAYKMVPSVKGHISIGSRWMNYKVFQEVFGDPNLLKGLSATFLMVLGHFMIIPFIAPALIRNSGLQQEQLPLLYLLGGVFTLFSTPAIGRLTDKFGVIRVYSVLVVLSAIPILMITHLGKSSVAVIFLLTTMLMIIASGRFVAANTLVTASVASSRRGGFMSLRSSVIELAEGIAAFLGGLIVTVGSTGKIERYHILGYISYGITVISLLLLRKVRKVD